MRFHIEPFKLTKFDQINSWIHLDIDEIVNKIPNQFYIKPDLR